MLPLCDGVVAVPDTWQVTDERCIRFFEFLTGTIIIATAQSGPFSPAKIPASPSQNVVQKGEVNDDEIEDLHTVDLRYL